VDVFELSEQFSVTEATIRRDLDKLAQQGFLVKIYGGAVLKEDFEQNPLLIDQDDKLAKEKKMIGKIASQMIEDGEAVFIGAGTTCLEIARHIKNKRVTVVTNDILVAYELKNCAGIKVLVTGGDLLRSSTALVGGFALRALEGIYISKAFIGVKGIHIDSGFTVNSHEEAQLAQSIIEISRETVVAADYTKFDQIGFARLGALTIAQKVISNKKVPDRYKTYFFEQAIKLFTAYELE
jgi:DeoR/GlpR family transcriptional regulator of sugar metabolism